MVSGISPNTGSAAGGTPITISGTGFQSGATVRIGGALANSVNVVSATQITALTPAGTPGAAAVQITNPDGQVGSLSSSFTYAQSPNPNATNLTVQTNQQFQVFQAWEVQVTGPDFLVSGVTQRVPPGVLSQILDDVAFDLGLNGLRIILHSAQDIEVVNDNNDPFVINAAGFDFARPYQISPANPIVDPVAQMQQVVLGLKSRVESRGETFYTYMSPIYQYSEFPSHWHNAEEYAELGEAYILWSRSTFGFTPTYWVIVNEPQNVFFSSNELVNDIIALGTRLRARGIPTKVQTTETMTPISSFTQSVLSNATAAQYVGLVSYHGYDYNTGAVPNFATRNNIRTTAQQHSLPTAMTEICCRTGWDGTYNQAIGWARDIHWNLTEADSSAWQPLALMNPCSTPGCTSGIQAPIVLEADLSRFYKFPQYYGLRQYSRYIRPGYRRVGVTCAACTLDSTVGQNIKPVAFQSPSGALVVVVFNDQAVAADISLSGLPAGTYDITGVDPAATTGRTYSSQTIGTGQSLSITLPSQAIVTFARR
jgi:hypothetical protein